MTEVLGAFARLNYRLVLAFEHYVKREEYKHWEAIRQETGMQQWTPKQRSLPAEYRSSTAERTCRASLSAPTKMGRGMETSSCLSYSIGKCVLWSEISSQQPPAPRSLLQPSIDGPTC